MLVNEIETKKYNSKNYLKFDVCHPQLGSSLKQDYFWFNILLKCISKNKILPSQNKPWYPCLQLQVYPPVPFRQVPPL